MVSARRLSAVFRRLCRLYPAPVRDVMVRDMTRTFARECRLQAATGGRRALHWFALRTFVDTMLDALLERVRRPHGRATRTPQPRLLLALNRSSPRFEAPVDILLHDLRTAFRSLRRNPGLTLAAVTTLGLGIGATTGIVSTFAGIVFRGLPVEDPNAIVVLGAELPNMGRLPTISYPNFLDFREHNEVFDDVIATTSRDVNLIVGESPHRVRLSIVSDNFFEMLGVATTVGRTFAPTDGSESDATLVLEHDYWARQHGGDLSIVGQAVLVNDHPFTVLGVAPEGFNGTSHLAEVTGWVPMEGYAAIDPSFAGLLERRSSNQFGGYARLKPGVTVEQADVAIDALVAELQRRYPDDNIGTSMAVVAERRARLGMDNEGAWLTSLAFTFLGLAALVLLIACANVANLLLLRATGRAREISTRAALGAGRARVLRQLLTESALLGALGGVAGLTMALWATRALAIFLRQWSGAIAFRYDIEPDLRVLALSGGLSLLSGLAIGVLPALRSTSANIVEQLKADGGTTTESARSQRMRGSLVIVQVALSLVLLVGSAAFVRSLWQAQAIPVGLRADNLLLLSVEPGILDYSREEAREFYRLLEERVVAMPGVDAAAFATYVPFGRSLQYISWIGEGQPRATAEDYEPAILDLVSTGYFEAAGTLIVRGRAPTEADEGQAVVVNQTMAEVLWPGEDPIDKRMTYRGAAEGFSLRVVGVAENGRYQQIWENPRRIVYLPMALGSGSSATLLVRTAGDPLPLVDTVRQAITELDAQMPVFNITTMEAHLRNTALMSLRVGAVLALTFGIVGAVLAAVGLYAVIAYSVGQRTQELGVRAALGADARRLLALVLRHGLLLAIVGLAVGAVAAILLRPTLTSFLLDVTPADPVTLVGVAGLVLLVALVAGAVPAWRATRVSPIQAMREH